jgi:hypothetical protein
VKWVDGRGEENKNFISFSNIISGSSKKGYYFHSERRENQFPISIKKFS